MACRDCKFYDLSAVQDKAGRVRQGRVGKCLWSLPADYKFPLALTSQYDWSEGRFRPRWMQARDGDGCPTFASIEEGAA